jgi:hypothetical protein
MSKGIVTFTGTKAGMSSAQLQTFHDVLKDAGYVALFRHGACVGADRQAHNAAWGHVSVIDMWPSNVTQDMWAKHVKQHYDRNTPTIFSIQPIHLPLTRNRLMLIDSGLLIATPRETEEVIRSGTWTTIRYARKMKVPIVRIHANGEIVRE